MAKGTYDPKFGSSAARAQRARQGHAKRRGHLGAVHPKTGRASYTGSAHTSRRNFGRSKSSGAYWWT
jgi:hypothetical protein